MITPPSYSEVRASFAQNGSLAIDACRDWRGSASKKEFLHFGAARIERSLFPLVAAHFAGFGGVQMAQVVINCGLTLEKFLDGIDHEMGSELEFDGEKADFVEFMRKSLDACLIASNHWSRSMELPENMVTLLRGSLGYSGRLALAIILLGRPQLSFLAYQKDLVEKLAEAEVGQGDGVVSGDFKTAFSSHLMLDAWPEDGPYNKGQLTDYLQGSGALDTLSIRNVAGLSAFWTNVIYGLSVSELCEPLIDLVFSTHPELALPIVRSFDIELALKLDGELGMRDLDTMANSLDCLMSCLKKADLGHALKPVDVMLNFAKAGANVHESDDPDENDYGKIMAGFRKAGIPEKIFENTYSGRVTIKEKVSALALRIDLTADLMNAQLKTPEHEVPMTHFMQWGFMARYGLIAGTLKPALVTRHLIHMSKVACSIKLQGYETLAVLRETYEGLDQCMRDLVAVVGPAVDIKVLLKESVETRTMLGLWGVDPRVLNITHGKAIDRWMAGDLGL